MSEHTKGKLEVSSSNSESIYVLKDGRADGLFATCDAGDYARSREEGYANAKELVRRWNAFEENYSVGLIANAEEIKQQRDDLLGATKNVVKDIKRGSIFNLGSKQGRDLLAAIAKCET